MSALHERLLAELHAERYDSPTEMRLAATLGAVVETHAPTTFLRRPLATPICETCSPDDDLHDERWPCSTIQAIADQLGLTEGTDRG